jgi:hypothetical protein
MVEQNNLLLLIIIVGEKIILSTITENRLTEALKLHNSILIVFIRKGE